MNPVTQRHVFSLVPGSLAAISLLIVTWHDDISGEFGRAMETYKGSLVELCMVTYQGTEFGRAMHGDISEEFGRAMHGDISEFGRAMHGDI